MKKVMLIISALFIALLHDVKAQDRILESLMVLNGIASEEELDLEIIERYEAYASHPLKINLLSANRLKASALLTRFQVASLVEYRLKYGDVLSLQELALIDGFGEERAKALEPFISFESRYGVKERGRDSLVVKLESQESFGLKSSEGELSLSALSKTRLFFSDALCVAYALKSSYASALWPPEVSSWSLVAYGNRIPCKIVLGDFNAKLGQGLVQWSGFSLSGFSSAASFAKHPSGIGPAWTTAPSSVRRGAAADLAFGRWTVSAFIDFNGNAGGNISRYGRKGEFGFAALSDGLASLSYRYALGKMDMFAEYALDWKERSLAGLSGLTYNHSYDLKSSLLLRAYPADYLSPYSGAVRSSTKATDELGLALAMDYHSLSLSLDAVRRKGRDKRQLKGRIDWNPKVSENLELRLRLSYRLKPEESFPHKEEAKMELRYFYNNGFGMNAGMAMCHNRGSSKLLFAGLSAANGKKFSFFLRGTAFHVDHWDDRIYLYDRDLPGSFSVPSFYGRGVYLSSLLSLKFRYISLYAKAAWMEYYAMKEEKPGKFELKVQMNFIF